MALAIACIKGQFPLYVLSAVTSFFFCSHGSDASHFPTMDRMKKIKRQLSMTLRGSRTVEKNLNEPINIEENNSSDNGEFFGGFGGGAGKGVQPGSGSQFPHEQNFTTERSIQ